MCNEVPQKQWPENCQDINHHDRWTDSTAHGKAAKLTDFKTSLIAQLNSSIRDSFW